MRFQAVSKRHMLMVLVLCSLALALAGSRAALPLRHAAQVILAPFGDVPMYATTSLTTALNQEPAPKLSAAEVEQLLRENKQLRKQSHMWQSNCERYYLQTLRLKNFQRLYGPTVDLGCELISARVVGAGSLPYDRGRVLSSGRRESVDVGELVAVKDEVTELDLATGRTKALPPKLAVVTESTLVGRVVDSGAFTARMQLVTDKGFRMKGRIRRVISPAKPRMITVTNGSMPQMTQLSSANNAAIDVLITGNGDGRVVVPGVKAYHNVLPGDYLYASTDEQNIPIEFYIGKVEKVEPSPDAKDAHRVRIVVRPHENIAGVRDVFIVSPISPLSENRGR